ncbi:DUF3027 domain-containing protein [Streptomyces sp. NPDC047108]|uniref:DUF3027 domain-containing protein n=1 Tax=Streptomyces sp. NPDC047108 TaxID=3155025 RepID=UPI0033E4D8BD
MRSRTPDRMCAEAVELALAAAVEAAGEDSVGEHLGAVAEGDRVVTHFFACREAAYRGWRWAVTVTRASRAKLVTLDETVLLPGPEALLAPEWVPWSERLRPGDLGPGDLLPIEADDLRLEPGYSGEDEPPPNSVVAGDAEAARESEDETAREARDEAAREATDETAREAAGSAEARRTAGAAGEAAGEASATPPPTTANGASGALQGLPSRSSIAALAEELGMRRARVLSRYGLHTAADRWEEGYGAKTPMAQAAPAACVSCGFLVPLAGSLRQAFGVCANEFSPADGRVVSLTFGCGGHSEAAVMPKPPRPAPPVIDETKVDPLPLRPDRTGGSVEDAGPEEELGHS